MPKMRVQFPSAPLLSGSAVTVVFSTALLTPPRASGVATCLSSRGSRVRIPSEALFSRAQRVCPIGPVVKMAVFQAAEEGSIPSWDTNTFLPIYISAHLVIEDRHASLVRKRAGFESLDGLCIHHKRPWPSS